MLQENKNFLFVMLGKQVTVCFTFLVFINELFQTTCLM